MSLKQPERSGRSTVESVAMQCTRRPYACSSATSEMIPTLFPHCCTFPSGVSRGLQRSVLSLVLQLQLSCSRREHKLVCPHSATIVSDSKPRTQTKGRRCLWRVHPFARSGLRPVGGVHFGPSCVGTHGYKDQIAVDALCGSRVSVRCHD